jgi:flagellar hook-basal body complex protein FliE
MDIGLISSIGSGLQLPGSVEKNKENGFENVLTEFIGSVNQDQLDANKMTNSFITGEDVELHDVMIAAEKAKTSLELLMEIRNKTIDMYKELIRMQA